MPPEQPGLNPTGRRAARRYRAAAKRQAQQEGIRSRSRSPGLPGREGYLASGVPLCSVCGRSGALCTRAFQGLLVEVCRTCFAGLETVDLCAYLPAGPALQSITEGLEVLYGVARRTFEIQLAAARLNDASKGQGKGAGQGQGQAASSRAGAARRGRPSA